MKTLRSLIDWQECTLRADGVLVLSGVRVLAGFGSQDLWRRGDWLPLLYVNVFDGWIEANGQRVGLALKVCEYADLSHTQDASA